MKRLFGILFCISLLLLPCQKVFSLTNTWPDNDARVDGSTDTMDEVDTFINTLSQDIHERVLATNGETVQIQTNWTATGKTCADLGTVTTADINGGTIDGVTSIGIGTTSPVGILQVGTSPTKGLVVIGAGNVGIGTTSPSALFEVGGVIKSTQATGTAPFTIASTTKSTNLNADLFDGYTTATTATASQIYVAGADGYLPDSTVDTTALKTAAEVESGGNGTYTWSSPGAYGFFPQVKQTNADTYNMTFLVAPGVSYVVGFVLTSVEGDTIYASMTYVTASGTDWWVYLLVDKNTQEILRCRSALDHPSYGSGGDYEKIPQPFGKDYDVNKHEIILLSKETVAQLLKEKDETGADDINWVIHNDYKVDINNELPYIPLHSGKWIIKKDTGEVVKSVPFGDDLKKYTQVKQMIETIPDYIKVRPLLKLSVAEKAEKKAKQEQARVKHEQDKVKKGQDKASAKQKLKTILTNDEIEAIIK